MNKFLNKSMMILLIFSFFQLLFYTGCSEKALPGVAIRFENANYNWGEILEGRIISHTFVFKNTGSETLIINEVKPTCGCTVTDNWDKEVQPGKKGKITAKLDTTGFKDHIEKAIIVKTNKSDNPDVTLHMEGKVKILLEIKEQNLWMGEFTTEGPEKSGEFDLINHDSKNVTIIKAVANEPNCTVNIVPVTPGKLFKVQFTLKPPYNEGYFNGIITIDTDNKLKPQIQAKYNYYVPLRVRVYPEEFILQKAQLKLTPREQLNIRTKVDKPIVVKNIKFGGDDSISKYITYEFKEEKDQSPVGNLAKIVFTFSQDFVYPAGKKLSVSFQIIHNGETFDYVIPIKDGDLKIESTEKK